MTVFVIKRIYETAESSDGYRVLVDRLWPRGVSKVRAALDEWDKDIAPSTKLRQWFGHEPSKFNEFTQRYVTEISANSKLPSVIARWHEHDKVTLLYGAKDTVHNEAVVLQRYLETTQ